MHPLLPSPTGSLAQPRLPCPPPLGHWHSPGSHAPTELPSCFSCLAMNLSMCPLLPLCHAADLFLSLTSDPSPGPIASGDDGIRGWHQGMMASGDGPPSLPRCLPAQGDSKVDYFETVAQRHPLQLLTPAMSYDFVRFTPGPPNSVGKHDASRHHRVWLCPPCAFPVPSLCLPCALPVPSL